eukprot:3545549-Prymnesium_polylepis.1
MGAKTRGEASSRGVRTQKKEKLPQHSKGWGVPGWVPGLSEWVGEWGIGVVQLWWALGAHMAEHTEEMRSIGEGWGGE